MQSFMGDSGIATLSERWQKKEEYLLILTRGKNSYKLQGSLIPEENLLLTPSLSHLFEDREQESSSKILAGGMGPVILAVAYEAKTEFCAY